MKIIMNFVLAFIAIFLGRFLQFILKIFNESNGRII